MDNQKPRRSQTSWFRAPCRTNPSTTAALLAAVSHVTRQQYALSIITDNDARTKHRIRRGRSRGGGGADNLTDRNRDTRRTHARATKKSQRKFNRGGRPNNARVSAAAVAPGALASHHLSILTNCQLFITNTFFTLTPVLYYDAYGNDA